MSPKKEGCRYMPCCCNEEGSGADCPGGETHPSWAAGMMALDDYRCWVEGVVLPIAFQWVEEHKTEVYAKVPDQLRDDVGVVIAAAFGLVKELLPYKEGLEKCKSYESARQAGTLDRAKFNPVWDGITRKIRTGMKEAFAEQSSLLGETIP